MKECKAWIAGVAGTKLTPDEVAFFRDEKPWGFILFARNVESLEQVAELTAQLREVTDRPQTPVFIDQEGGRVQRLRPPLVPNYPAAAQIGAIYDRDPEAGLRAAWLHARLHAFDLLKVGVNADCLPVLDVPIEGAHDVIGARIFQESAQCCGHGKSCRRRSSRWWRVACGETYAGAWPCIQRYAQGAGAR